ncbi:DUF998 domain-containing protein [Micromonospora polyrhachis]|uniref:DUF998 domain-containing protein n=1 Tax=Micromonospora polyrhachis TaxID=1282883 RepID=A0A7W7SW70_9ACTN|nr:DUF998 domain-containing protein [Micromonospora polyrhachis]MBB4960795.1 hypothetical protein [Micromonospora polyrhachis]
MTNLLLGAGVVGTVLFVVTFLVDGLTRPGYDPVRQPVSALALGPRGWVQVTSFVLCGGLITASALGLGQATGSLWLAIAVAVFGLALVASGVFPMDPMRGYPPGTPDETPSELSWRHHVHDGAGIVVFAALPTAAIVAVFALDGEVWRWYSGFTAVAATLLFVGFGQAWEQDSPRTGLIQRVAIIVGWSWLGVLCAQLAYPS